MTSNKMKIEVALLVISISLTMMLYIDKVSTQETGTIVYVDPPEIRDLLPPAQFTIYVKIKNVTNLYGLDLQFTWDPNIIKYVSHQKHIPVETYPDGVLHSPTIPVKDQVKSYCEMLGIDPLSLACEGRVLLSVRGEKADEILEGIKGLGFKEASIIGEVREGRGGYVVLKSVSGGLRILEPPTGEIVPRIC